MTRAEAQSIIEAHPRRTLVVRFTGRSDSTLRRMACVYYPTGATFRQVPKEKGLLPVWDIEKGARRFTGLDGVQSVKVPNVGGGREVQPHSENNPPGSSGQPTGEQPTGRFRPSSSLAEAQERMDRLFGADAPFVSPAVSAASADTTSPFLDAMPRYPLSSRLLLIGGLLLLSGMLLSGCRSSGGLQHADVHLRGWGIPAAGSLDVHARVDRVCDSSKGGRYRITLYLRGRIRSGFFGDFGGDGLPLWRSRSLSFSAMYRFLAPGSSARQRATARIEGTGRAALDALSNHEARHLRSRLRRCR